MIRSQRVFWGVLLMMGTGACGEPADEPKACDFDPPEYRYLPTITAIEPESGPPGTTVTLTGVNFDRIDDRYEAAYSDFSAGCNYTSLQGEVRSDFTAIEVVIPEDATSSGYIYLLADGLTVARSDVRFELDLEATPAVVNVVNQSQFPIVSVEAAWTPVLETGTWVDVEQTQAFEVDSGPVHLELCVGDRHETTVEPWICDVYDMRLTPGEETTVTMRPISAARFLAGEWGATWEIGTDETDEEHLRIETDGYWELRHDQRVVESGMLIEAPWAPYNREFEFSLRPGDRNSRSRVPVRSFALTSSRANDQITFYRTE